MFNEIIFYVNYSLSFAIRFFGFGIKKYKPEVTKLKWHTLAHKDLLCSCEISIRYSYWFNISRIISKKKNVLKHCGPLIKTSVLKGL